jgi:hypothetical protein
MVGGGAVSWWPDALDGGFRRWLVVAEAVLGGEGKVLGCRWAPVHRLERERERERETTSWERVRFGKWRENLESESEMSTHPRFQRLFLNFLNFY